jgi:hypothetical protein
LTAIIEQESSRRRTPLLHEVATGHLALSDIFAALALPKPRTKARDEIVGSSPWSGSAIRYPGTQLFGLYQIGEVYARSWVIISASAGI